MAHCNRTTNSGSVLEADDPSRSGTKMKPQRSSGEKRKGTTVPDGAVQLPTRTQQFLTEGKVQGQPKCIGLTETYFLTDETVTDHAKDLVRWGPENERQISPQNYRPSGGQPEILNARKDFTDSKLPVGTERNVNKGRAGTTRHLDESTATKPVERLQGLTTELQAYHLREKEIQQASSFERISLQPNPTFRPSQPSFFPTHLPEEPDYLQGAELYAPAPSQPLTVPEFTTQYQDAFPSHLVPPFVLDKRLSSSFSSSSSNSFHSFSSSSSSSSVPSGSGAVPQPELDRVAWVADIGSIRLEDEEMDCTESATNQHKDIGNVDLDNSESANQLRRLFQRNEDGDTVLHLAIIEGVTELTMMRIVSLFRAQNLLNVPNNRLQTPLHLATITRRPDVIGRLLRNGASSSVHDRRLETPLHIACREGDAASVDELTHPYLTANCQELEENLRSIIESPNRDGQTCLHLAAFRNHLETVRYLVEVCRTNVNLKELRRGRTILHQAVESGNLELLRYLLNLSDTFELFVDDLTYDGFTALQMARFTRQTTAQELLLLAGAQPIVEVDTS